MTEKQSQPLRIHWLDHRNLYLLVSLLLMLVLRPILLDIARGLFIELLFVLIVGASALAVSRTRHRTILVVSSVLVLVVLRVVTFLNHSGTMALTEGAQLRVLSICATLLFLALSTVPVLVDALRTERIHADKVWGAVSVYLLLGLSWGLVYSLIEILQPGSFDLAALAAQPGAGPESIQANTDSMLLYYSFVTLSTLGYGDITPMAAVPRALSALEAIAGQLFLAVLVARLVAIHMSASSVSRTGSPEQGKRR